LHWVLDVTFREDDSRVRRDNASENLGVFRHVAFNSLRNEKTCKKGIKAKRYKAALQPEYAKKNSGWYFLSTHAFALGILPLLLSNQDLMNNEH
jgi:hypothetical protein